MIEPNDYRWIRLTPADAWFFRDGRPANRGEDQGAVESEFPPNPTTVVGAIRAALARANGWNGRGSWADQSEELRTVLGDGFDDLGRLRFLGPFLCKQFSRTDGRPPRDELLWPLPQHVVGHFEGDAFVPKALLEPSEPVCCDADPDGVSLAHCPDSPRTAGAKPPSHPDDIYVTTTGLNDILRGRLPDASECIPAARLYSHESRVGIALDPRSRTVVQGHIYNPRFVRLLPGTTLVEGVAGIPESWDWPGITPLGGESRMAHIERLETPPELPQTTPGPAAILVVLAPARFDTPWWGAGPKDSASRLCGDLSGNVTCVALDRPQPIGGWSFQGGPRPMAPHAAPGTVWWLADSSTASALVQVGGRTAYGYGFAALSAAPN